MEASGGLGGGANETEFDALDILVFKLHEMLKNALVHFGVPWDEVDRIKKGMDALAAPAIAEKLRVANSFDTAYKGISILAKGDNDKHFFIWSSPRERRSVTHKHKAEQTLLEAR